MAITYELFIADPLGNQLDVIDEWLSLEYAIAVNEVGSLTMLLDGNYFFSFLKEDSRIGVYRNNHLEGETTWLIRYLERKLARNGTRTITVEAESAMYLLDGRVAAYEEGSSQVNQTDLTDDMMKAIVRQNLGSSASAFRNISSYMSVAEDSGQGPSLSKEFPYDNVLGVLKEISQASIIAGSPVYFDVVAPTFSTLEFRTYRELRGNDHSFPNGINPVILSPNRGNLVEATRAYDWRDEITYVYAGAQGAVYTASSSDRINVSPFNLREAYVNVSGTSGSSAGQDEADTALRAGRPRRTFQGELVNVPGATEYGVHWGLGDKVTVEFEQEVIDCTIDAVTVKVAQGKEIISATLRALED